MKTIHFLMTMLMATLLMASCSKEETFPANPDDDLNPTDNQVQSAHVIDPIHGNQVIGQALLKRQATGITMKYETTGLIPGHTYTIWWVVWNKPENCLAFPGACDAPDFENAEAVEVEVMYAAGKIADHHGNATFSGHLNIDNASDSINDLFGFSSFGGLKDPVTAEVHLVLRSHGPAIPGQVHNQLTSYQGGCTTYLPDFTEVPDEEGECADLHFAVFQGGSGQ